MSLIILPRPVHMVEGPGRWSPGKDLPGLTAETSIDSKLPGILISEKTEIPAGAYRLNAGPGGVRISASGSEGRRNALMTLRQALRQTAQDGTLPELEIDDRPAFRTRGVMLDISRTRVPAIRTLKSIINLLAELKYNQIQLYTEHTFAYKGHEKVWKDASPYSGEDIDEIDIYCRTRGIELVPNQNSFGHMERWLRYPEYHHLAEAPDGYEDPWGVYKEFASTLDPSAPESMEFLKNLYNQLLPHFQAATSTSAEMNPLIWVKERAENDVTNLVSEKFTWSF